MQREKKNIYIQNKCITKLNYKNVTYQVNELNYKTLQ